MLLGAQSAQSALWGKKCSFCQNCESSMKFMKIALFHENHVNLLFWRQKSPPEMDTCIAPNQPFHFRALRRRAFPENSRNFMKFHEISRICEYFAKKCTFPARGGNPSLAQGILMVLGPNSAQKCISGQNPPKSSISAIFHGFRRIPLNFTQLR